MVVKKPKIVIVGAGLAGLTAAYRLHTAAAGLFDLTVVEAGDRTGGRILTSEFAGDRVEVGATWIHGIGGSPIYALASELNLITDPSRPWERMDGFPENPLTVFEGGEVVDDATIADPITALYKLLMDAARSGEAPIAKDNPGVGPYLRRGLQLHRAAATGAAASGGGSRAVKEQEDAVFSLNENSERTCTSADDLAVLDLAAESEYRDFPGDQITIGRGFSRIIEWFASHLPDGAVCFGKRLRRVEWRPDAVEADGAVRLHFDDGDSIVADHVIVTVSLGVLKASIEKGAGEAGVVFCPGLPAFKQDAIARLGFGVVNKLFMELEDAGDAGEEGDSKFPYLQLAFNQEREVVSKIPKWMRRTAFICPVYVGSRVLLAWLAGAEAMELEGLDDEEVLDGVHATLEGFGEGRRRIARVKRSGWGTNPLFLGSYSYVAVGSSGDDLDLMAEPLPRCGGGEGGGEGVAPLQLLFAGEATHRTHYSTTHGAYFSGMREANRLLRQYHFICR